MTERPGPDTTSLPAALVIAIDGPSASGKSTVARAVAQALGYTYVDTGAMYRTVTWAAMQRGVDLHQERAVMDMVKGLGVELKLVENRIQMWVDGYYPEKEIRQADVSAAVPVVAAISPLRKWIVEFQQSLARFGNLVMEGRDIGSVVFPQSPCKFYLDAKPEVRAHRRHQEGVVESLETRDHRDSSRKASPLKIAPGAQVIDTSGMTIEQVVAKILEAVVVPHERC